MPTNIDTTEQAYLFYDEYRTLLLNKKYYGNRLEQFKKYNMIMECAIAVGATGSGVAGFAVWQTQVGGYAWAIISAISILLATVKPFLRFTDRIENYGKLFGEYTRASLGMKILVEDLQVRKTILEEDLKVFSQIRSRMAELATLEDPKPDPEVVRSLQQEVNAEIVIARLWVPPAA
jgi:hypothetical protein